VGKREFACPSEDAEDERVDVLRAQGKVAVFVSCLLDGTYRPVAIYGIMDPVKAEAYSTVRALQNMGLRVYMCTGDHIVTARAVSKQIGIPQENIYANATPKGKADFVTKLMDEKRGKVAIVGDGINDSIALARADVGIAIGAGTEVAVEAADIVLLRSTLHDVIVVLHLSRVVFNRIKLNFIWALGYNMCALPFAAGAFSPVLHWRLPPAFAGLMMAFSSVSVVASSLLLRMYRKPTINDDGSVDDMTFWAKFFRYICRCRTKEREPPIVSATDIQIV